MHMKNCLTSLIYQRNENQNYNELSAHTTQNGRHQKSKALKGVFTPSPCWRGCDGKGTLLPSWGECKLVQPLRRTVWRFLKKLKIELSYNPAIPPLGMYQKKSIIWKLYIISMFTAALFTIAKKRKQTKFPSTEKWIKMWYIYTMEY